MSIIAGYSHRAVNIAKRSFYRALRASGISALKFKAFSARGTILMYHRVAADNGSPFRLNANIEIPLSLFEKHIKFLAKNCSVISLEDLLTRIGNGEKFPPHAVALTFDDGYFSNYEFVLPILKKYRFPAVFYITTSFVEGEIPYWNAVENLPANCNRRVALPDGKKQFSLQNIYGKMACFRYISAKMRKMSLAERKEYFARLTNLFSPNGSKQNYFNLMMTWEQIREIADNPLFQVGAHTLNHPNLARESADTAKEEIFRSKKILEEKLGKTIRTFAYPYGDADTFTEETEAIVKAQGFSNALTAVPGHIGAQGENFLRLPRIAVDGRDGVSALKAKLSGIFSALKRCCAR